jgi:hypothetical protein
VIRTTSRTARKRRACDCGHSIVPGEPYLEHVASPHHQDLGNEHWWRLAECQACATRHGRGDVLEHAS